MGEINAFIDESGSIKKGDQTSPDFFVIGMAFTNNEKLTSRQPRATMQTAK